MVSPFFNLWKILNSTPDRNSVWIIPLKMCMKRLTSKKKKKVVSDSSHKKKKKGFWKGKVVAFLFLWLADLFFSLLPKRTQKKKTFIFFLGKNTSVTFFSICTLKNFLIHVFYALIVFSLILSSHLVAFLYLCNVYFK